MLRKLSLQIILTTLSDIPENTVMDAYDALTLEECAALRTKFLASLGEADPQRALPADLGPGITTFLNPKHGVMVRVPGYGDAMTWRSALKAFGPK